MEPEVRQKSWFTTDEFLRIIQIAVVLMSVGVFVDTTRDTKIENKSQAKEITDLRVKQEGQEQVMLRVVSILSDLEARVSAHAEADAAVSETVKRNTALIDRYFLKDGGR